MLRRRFMLIAGAALLVAIGAIGPARAASATVDTSFVAPAAVGTYYGDAMRGPYGEEWTAQTLTVGPSPAAASLTIHFAVDRYCGYYLGLTIDDHLGDSLFGGSSCGSGPRTTFPIVVGQATGSWAALAGHVGQLMLSTDPKAASLRPTVDGLDSPCIGCQKVDPIVLIGRLTIS